MGTARRRPACPSWLRLAGGSVLGASVAGAPGLAPRPAMACHEEPRDRYSGAVNVGVTVGVGFGPRPRFAYGIDVRFGTGPAVPFLRLEGRGGTFGRLLGGVQVFTPGFGGELALAAHGARAAESIGAALGLQAGGGLWDPNATLFAQGTLPVAGDRRNWDAGLAGFLVLPGRICLPSGRPLWSDDGELLTPAIWDLAGAPECPTRGALRASWIERAAAEHASIAAFVRMAAELRAAGAPAGLVDAALASAADEARHTGQCAAMAGGGLLLRPLAAQAARPRWQRPWAGALARLGIEAWRDGCLGEGTAAALAAREAGRAVPEEVATTCAAIARDERRHAELAWQVLTWCWREGGPAVREAIEAAACAPEAPSAPDPAEAAATDSAWLATRGKLAGHEQRQVAGDEAERARARFARGLLRA